jgi:Uma2 family endonuclease
MECGCRGFQVWKDFTPFWVAEIVSPDQEDRDYEHKHRDYWLAGISEYWIVDRHERRVVVMVRGPEKWIETTYQEHEQANSTSLPGFEIAAIKLLGQART